MPPHHAPGLLETDLGDELVLTDPSGKQQYSLNATARIVWRHLGSATIRELADAVCKEFDVDHETAMADVVELLNSLEDSGLIVGDESPH